MIQSIKAKVSVLQYAWLLLLVVSWLIPSSTVAQRMKVSGVVVSDTGEPLMGVQIRLAGSSKRYATNAKGQFSLTANKGAQLFFHYIGMRTQKVRVKEAKMKVELHENVQQIEGAVVTGYQRIQNRVFTGSATMVKMDKIRLNGTADLSRMLEGRVAGLSIQNISGSFGTAPRINIRGGASIMGSVQPLWVIDGVVYEDLVPLSLDQLASGDAVTLIGSAVAGLNPADIKDVQVLKDASATSIYGARALNGVIVVSTRSGQRNTPNRITYNGELTVRQVPSYASFNLLNSQETMGIYQEMNNKGYFSLKNTLFGRRSGAFYQWYKGVSTLQPGTNDYIYENTAAAMREFMRTREYANTDWFQELFSNRLVHSHTLTFSGGSERSALYASIGYYDDGGWTIADNVRRLTANVRNTFFLGDKVKASFIALGNMRSQDAPGTVPQRKNTIIGGFERDFDINPFSYALGTSRTLPVREADGQLSYYRNNWAPFNILNEYDNNYIKTSVLDFKLQADVSYKPVDALQLRAMMSARQAQTTTSHYILENSNVVQAYRANETPFVAQENIYLYRPEHADLPIPALTQGGMYNRTDTRLKSYMGRLSAEFEKTWYLHNLRAFGFTEVRNVERTLNPFEGYGIQYDRGNQVYPNPLIFYKMALEEKSYFALTKRKDRGVTFSGNATYAYDGRYILNAVVNYEGTNRAGSSAHSRWLPTWNVGAKWNVDQEPFMAAVPTISKLAVRSSYGLTAKMNQKAISANAIFQNHLIMHQGVGETENGMHIFHLENRDLTWEKMYELNVGPDFGLFDNRIATTLDIYQRSSFDLIDLVRTSGVGGMYYKYANFGDMRTRGIEWSLKTKNVITPNFLWTTSLTFSAMKQEITRLLSTPNTFDMVSGTGKGNVVGFPRGSLFSFNFQRLNNEGLPTFDFGYYPLPDDAKSQIAGANFLDAQYSKTYLIYHGPIEPTYMGGLSNTFTYKGWEFSFFMTVQGGNKIRLNPTFDPAFADLNVFSQDYYDRWLVPGDEWRTNVPTIPSRLLMETYGEEDILRAYNTYNYSQLRVADGTFVRMKNIALAYHFGKKTLTGLHLSGLSLKINLTNPFLIYSDPKLHGQDPEFYRSGGVSLPTPKQCTMTLNVNF